SWTIGCTLTPFAANLLPTSICTSLSKSVLNSVLNLTLNA
ncbi:MAG: hypothetical protein ACI9B8_001967, partial [Sulfitobacter sp.]